jgi:lipopolysaccharide transport system ATP-binding protein
MSSETAIRVAGLGKCYHLYEQPRDRLLQMLARGRKRYYREFWALRDVSFEVRRGETLGIIGRNGSGKSTLLQLICGTSNPTAGEVDINGRVAALLELGAGFNPDFSGRENVYMNGAVFGLSRAEIDARYADIVAFAELGDFIEQPVKTYSSGMHVRLAFSVAIHVEPEILVIDEALSVGDAFFQAKCARVMRDIIARGATVLFVSHDTAAVKSLCQRAVLLEGGRVKFVGEVNAAVETYYASLVAAQGPAAPAEAPGEAAPVPGGSSRWLDDNAVFRRCASFQRIQNGSAEFLNVLVLDDQERPIETVEFGQDIIVRQVVRVRRNVPLLGLAYHIRDKNGLDIVYSDTGLESVGHIESPAAGSVYIVDWRFQAHLRDGNYVIASMASEPVDLSIGRVVVADFVPIACRFSISRSDALPIYGAVYWKNRLKVVRVDRAS